MFSPRLLAVFAFVVTVAALPATDKPAIPKPVTTITEDDVEDPWFSIPFFGNLFAPLFRFFPSFTDIGPRIVADDDKFQVIVNVKDYSKEDLKVKVKGEFIFIQGTHEAKQDDRDIFASQFFHTYSLPANCSGSDVTAELSNDGYLVVTAPLNGPVDKTKELDREVPIVETGKPYQKEDKTDKPAVAPVSESEDERKEPTTPATEVTDNSIPHGNEGQL